MGVGERTSGTPTIGDGLVHWRDFEPSWLPGGESHPLAPSYATYRDHLDELLPREGEYVAIRDGAILGPYPRRRQAIDAALATFGPVPVLVKKIVESEPPRHLGGVTS